MIGAWVKGIVTTRPGDLAVAAAGIVVATALVGIIGVFGMSSARTMTQRALTAVPVDWQVAVAAGADVGAVADKLAAIASLRATEKVGYADAAALTARTGDTTQTTGAGQMLGLRAGYAGKFPGQIRLLLGSAEGVLLAQQTAANLHATVGDRDRKSVV